MGLGLKMDQLLHCSNQWKIRSVSIKFRKNVSTKNYLHFEKKCFWSILWLIAGIRWSILTSCSMQFLSLVVSSISNGEIYTSAALSNRVRFETLLKLCFCEEISKYQLYFYSITVSDDLLKAFQIWFERFNFVYGFYTVVLLYYSNYFKDFLFVVLDTRTIFTFGAT